MVRIQNDILRATDNQEVTILLLLDLSAAFDTVYHAILINRLEKSVGIEGNALKWFVSYLNGRRQCVMINNASSQFADIKFGVPQGSVLGPILFSLYTLPQAGILKQHGVYYHLYADDTQLYISIKPSYENENKIMERVINCIDDVKT